jgi:predicted nuclease of predicted toxin-antitoxin system
VIPLVLDQGLPRRAAEQLRALGWDAVHVGELALHRAEDAQVLELARERGAVAVTLDADFAGILAETAAVTPSVIHVRRERVNAAVALELIPRVVAGQLVALQAGAVVSVTESRVRCRLLPISRKGSRSSR